MVISFVTLRHSLALRDGGEVAAETQREQSLAPAWVRYSLVELVEDVAMALLWQRLHVSKHQFSSFFETAQFQKKLEYVFLLFRLS